eukprot:TRINITY_DN12886_c0_g1_i1.p2 TRINITY_DN12886_c0_g1~~TRINITY_DN12886_c0_g1_i1.p2  ORF type:complete len:106 (-),score=0.94 TRINITY_DN12886_c0_g1_i1:162-479(-)
MLLYFFIKASFTICLRFINFTSWKNRNIFNYCKGYGNVFLNLFNFHIFHAYNGIFNIGFLATFCTFNNSFFNLLNILHNFNHIWRRWWRGWCSGTQHFGNWHIFL